MNEPALYQLQECVCEIYSIVKLTCVSQECIGRRLCEFESLFDTHESSSVYMCFMSIY